MLPKNLRIKNSKTFQEIYKKGIKVKGTYGMSIAYLEKTSVNHSTNQPEPKFGIVIGKKTAKKAVDRNYQKRRISFIIRDWINNKDNFNVINNLNGELKTVFITFPQILNQKDYKKLEKDIKKQLSKLLKKMKNKENSTLHN